VTCVSAASWPASPAFNVRLALARLTFGTVSTTFTVTVAFIAGCYLKIRRKNRLIHHYQHRIV
ncbi:MAG: hypothetical protein II939_00230, partial [Bacteroidales bacterium]|nr:hypothetical protein [Bacteroidales bacterium]